MGDFYLPNWPVTEADVRALAGGTVPEWLQEIARRMVDWSIETGPLDFAGRREAQQQQAPRKARRRHA